MKTLIVYYSYEGSTKFIAETIANEIEADLLELKPEIESNHQGIMKYFWLGKQVVFKEKPELMPFQLNPENYDFILIGTPVWAGSYAPPLRTFFATNNLEGKKIAMFSCSEGGDKNIMVRMKEALGNNTIIGEQKFIQPLKRDKENNESKARQWAKTLIQTSNH